MTTSTTKANILGFTATSIAAAAAIFLYNGDPIAWEITKYGLPLIIGMLIASY